MNPMYSFYQPTSFSISPNSKIVVALLTTTVGLIVQQVTTTSHYSPPLLQMLLLMELASTIVVARFGCYPTPVVTCFRTHSYYSSPSCSLQPPLGPTFIQPLELVAYSHPNKSLNPSKFSPYLCIQSSLQISELVHIYYLSCIQPSWQISKLAQVYYVSFFSFLLYRQNAVLSLYELAKVSLQLPSALSVSRKKK